MNKSKMLPNESTPFQVEVKVEVEEEPEEEEGEKVDEQKIHQRISQFLNECTNEDADGIDFEGENIDCDLNYELNKEPWTTSTNNIPYSFPTPVPTSARSKHHHHHHRKHTDLDPDYQEGELKCSYCKKEFPTRQKLTLHQTIHNKKYHCILCEFKGRSGSDLTSHLRTHTKEKPWKCPEPQCKSSFTRKHGLEYHKFSQHGLNEKNYKVFQCEHCPFQTIKEIHLKYHKDSVHNRVLKFQCPEEDCSYSCSTKTILTLHKQRLHSELAPFKCNEPEFKYATKAKQYLKTHLEQIHSKSREEINDIVENGRTGRLVSIELESQSSLQLQLHTENNASQEQQQKSKPQNRYLVKSCKLYCVNCEFYTQDHKQLAMHLNSQHNLPRVHLKILPLDVEIDVNMLREKENNDDQKSLPCASIHFQEEKNTPFPLSKCEPMDF